MTDGEARVSTVVLGDDGSVTRLYEFGPEVSPAGERALLELVGARPAGPGEWAVVTGAAPPGVSPGFYAALVGAARTAGYRTLVDATGEQLAGALAQRPDLVKVNLAEACSAVGAPEMHCDDEKTARAGRAGGRGPRALPAAGRRGSCRRRPHAGRRRRRGRPGRRRMAHLHAAGQGREPGRLRRLLRRRPDARAAARGEHGRGAAPGRGRRRRQRGLAVQRRRGPALAEELAGGAYAGPPSTAGPRPSPLGLTSDRPSTTTRRAGSPAGPSGGRPGREHLD